MPRARSLVDRASAKTRQVARRAVNSPVAIRMPPYDQTVHRQIVAKRDFVRLSAFCLALSRLDRERIGGAIAELGVFRGDTSVVLQAAASHRDLHLFDTFAGFPRDQLDVPGDDCRFDA